MQGIPDDHTSLGGASPTSVVVKQNLGWSKQSLEQFSRALWGLGSTSGVKFRPAVPFLYHFSRGDLGPKTGLVHHFPCNVKLKVVIRRGRGGA